MADYVFETIMGLLLAYKSSYSNRREHQIAFCHFFALIVGMRNYRPGDETRDAVIDTDTTDCYLFLLGHEFNHHSIIDLLFSNITAGRMVMSLFSFV
jgi:hypothetical protein